MPRPFRRTAALLALLATAAAAPPAAQQLPQPAADRAEMDAAVARIRRRYVIIERALRDYVHERRELAPGEFSLEGGSADAWFSDAGLRKLSATHFGETGRTREQLYFWADTLIFAYEVEERYERALNAETPVRVVSRIEQRYYFADTVLVGWIGTRRGRGVQPPPAEAVERAAELRRTGAALRALFTGPKRR